MITNRFAITALLLLFALPVTADCPRVPGKEDDRRANAGCLIIQDSKVLLLTHRWGGKLGLPGGTLEAGELAQCTAWRETREEAGLTVAVGERLAVMTNGFHVYRCYPQAPMDTSQAVPVPRSGKTEVSAIGWYELSSLSKEGWRFYYQFEQFLEVAGKAMQSETAKAQDSASDEPPEK